MRKIAAIATALILVLTVGFAFADNADASVPDELHETYVLPYDGANDSTKYYQVERKDAEINKTIDITKGLADTSDLIEPTGDYALISDITNVSQGTTWWNETDDWLLNGDYLDWSPTDTISEPSPDSTYTVKYDKKYNGTIQVDAWKDNMTAKVTFRNIHNVTLNLSKIGLDLDDVKSYLQTSGGGTITIILATPTSHEMNFTITGVPEWHKAYLDGSDWSTASYTYTNSTKQLDFTLSMSTHTIEFDYQSIGEEWTDTLVPMFITMLSFMLVLAVVRGVVGIAQKAMKRMK